MCQFAKHRKFSCAEIVGAGMRVAVHVAQCHGHLLSTSDFLGLSISRTQAALVSRWLPNTLCYIVCGESLSLGSIADAPLPMCACCPVSWLSFIVFSDIRSNAAV